MKNKVGGTREASGLGYDSLVPPEAKAVAQAAFMYGAKKYTREVTNRWEGLWNVLSAVSLKITTAKGCVEIVTKQYSGETILSLNKDSVTIEECGLNDIQKRSSFWKNAEKTIHTLGNVTPEQDSSLILQSLTSQKTNTTAELQTDAKFAEQKNIYTSIIVTKQDCSEEFSVQSTTTDLDFWETIFPELKLRFGISEISKLDAAIGVRNWEKGLYWQAMIDSLKRHIDDFERGKDYDDGEGGSGLPQIANIMASACMLAASVVRGIGIDDRAKETEETRALNAKECSFWIRDALERSNKFLNKE